MSEKKPKKATSTDVAELINNYKKRNPEEKFLPIEFDLYGDLQQVEDEWYKHMDSKGMVPKFQGARKSDKKSEE